MLKKYNKILEIISGLFAPRHPVYVFHHLPKCGGTSLREIINSWFTVIWDYRDDETWVPLEKTDLNRLRSCHCLCGHYDVDGYYLNQRYPEVLKTDSFRVFTFVRDPLQIKLSLYYFEKRMGRNKFFSIEDHLFARPNYLAERFPALTDNYKEVIDKYFYVGIIEHYQESVDLLANIIGKKSTKVPWVNKSRNTRKTGLKDLSEKQIERFREDNKLDYLIYDYCVEKFKKDQRDYAS